MDRRALFQRLRFACPSGHRVKKDYNRPSVTRGLAFRERRRSDVRRVEDNPKLFVELSHQRWRRKFAGFYLPAREFPQAAVIPMGGAAMHKDTAVLTP